MRESDLRAGVVGLVDLELAIRLVDERLLLVVQRSDMSDHVLVIQVAGACGRIDRQDVVLIGPCEASARHEKAVEPKRGRVGQFEGALSEFQWRPLVAGSRPGFRTRVHST
jgi:hypothetical protein